MDHAGHLLLTQSKNLAGRLKEIKILTFQNKNWLTAQGPLKIKVVMEAGITGLGTMFKLTMD